MINITNINSQRFTLNGISYYKNFLSQVIGDPVSGDLIRIVNAYDSKFELLRPTKFNNITVNGGSFASAQTLQLALLPVLYVRGTLGDGSYADNGVIQISPLEIIEDPDNPLGLAVKIPIDPVEPIWRIGGIDYTKLTETIIPIPFAAVDNYRIDVIVGNTANGFERIVGEERSDIGVPPALPFGTVEIVQVNIYGNEIGVSPPSATGFITKASKKYQGITLTETNARQLPLSHEATTYNIKTLAGSGEVKGFFSLGTIDDSNTYDGMDIYIRNHGIPPITLLHNNEDVTIPFWFANEEDLEVPQNAIVHLKLSKSENRVELVGVFSMPFDPSTTDLDEFLNASSNPFVRDAFLNGYLTSVDYDHETHILTFQRKGVTPYTIDLPIEQLIEGLSYDETTNELVLTLESGAEQRVPLNELVVGLASEEWVLNRDLDEFKNESANKFIRESGLPAPPTAPAKTLRGRKSAGTGAIENLSVEEAKEMLGWSEFTHQIIDSGGNYTNLEVTADLLVFTNNNAQAIIHGIYGKKQFHVLNLSTQYEIRFNHDSPSVSGEGVPIQLPTSTGYAGVSGTARLLYYENYGYFLADTWASLYRPEYAGLTEEMVMTVGSESRAGAMPMKEFIVYRPAQAAPMSKLELNNAYPNSKLPFDVVCPQIKTVYKKLNDENNEWMSLRQIEENEARIYTEKVTVSAEDLFTIQTTGAPFLLREDIRPIGTVISTVSNVVMRMNYNGVPFDFSADETAYIYVRQGGGNFSTFYLGRLDVEVLNTEGDIIREMEKTAVSLIGNQAIYLYYDNFEAQLTEGNGTLDIFITYQIITL